MVTRGALGQVSRPPNVAGRNGIGDCPGVQDWDADSSIPALFDALNCANARCNSETMLEMYSRRWRKSSAEVTGSVGSGVDDDPSIACACARRRLSITAMSLRTAASPASKAWMAAPSSDRTRATWLSIESCSDESRNSISFSNTTMHDASSGPARVGSFVSLVRWLIICAPSDDANVDLDASHE
eukprot:scaffold92778_cov36-Tisochrysis_lutea.AAC.2